MIAKGSDDFLRSSVVHLGRMSLCLKMLLCDQYILEWVGVMISAGPLSSLHRCQGAQLHITGLADQFGLFLSATLKRTLVVYLLEQNTRLDHGPCRTGLMKPALNHIHPIHLMHTSPLMFGPARR